MNPLLTEYDENRRFGHFLSKLPFIRSLLPSKTDLQGSRLATVFFFSSLTASVLSVLSNAGIIIVKLVHLKNDKDTRTIEFGYLYELNAAFFYVFLAPLFIFIGVRFIRNAQFALDGLATRKLLIVNPVYKSRAPLAKDPLVVLGERNRRFFRPAFLILILIAVAFVVVGTEFRPNRQGDYWNLAFGYVQAPFIPEYESKTLDQLGREINIIGQIDPAGNENWRQEWGVEEVKKGGPQTNLEKVLFWVFIIFALGVQVLFIPFTIWIFFKAIFLLYVIHRAISPDPDTPNPKFPLEIKLDFEDDKKAFGLIDLHQVYDYQVALIFIGAAGMASAVVANVAKGSHKVVHSDGVGSILGSFAQSTVAFLPLIIFFVLAVFLFLLRLKAEEARNQVVAKLNREIEEADMRKEKLKQKKDLIRSQKAWPDLKFTTRFGAAFPSYLLPSVFVINKPDWVLTVYQGWKIIADVFERFISALGNIIK